MTKTEITIDELGELREKLTLPDPDEFKERAIELTHSGVSYADAVIMLREGIQTIVDQELLEPAGFMRCVECHSICERKRKDQRFCSRECANRRTVRDWRERQGNKDITLY